MAVFQCKMCGGSIVPEAKSNIVKCEYCDSWQTLPKVSDDVTTNLFNRANKLRLKGEFDRSAEIYEKLIAQDDTNAEAHWGLVLCRYGIEYVEDPKTGKRIPTCHRTCLEAVTKDEDYQAAVDYADESQQKLYEQEARYIDRLQRDILSVVKNEKPFDVFICYKETDEHGKRTVDSTIANDIYHQLTQIGMKVFYAAITLEDKLGQAYEPYIYAALNSAKVMLVLGTKPEYFNAVWVKNEWGRFIKLAQKDHNKLLIPCYRNMDPYELPDEFAHLQAQDMSKIGFINDVIHGIQKVLKINTSSSSSEAKATDTSTLLKRAFIFLEDENWNDADEYCEKVLDRDPENAQAYLCKLMAQLQVRNLNDLSNCNSPFDTLASYQRIMRYGDEPLKQLLREYLIRIKERSKEDQCQTTYRYACKLMEDAEKNKGASYPESAKLYRKAADAFQSIPNYQDANQKLDQCTAAAAKMEASASGYNLVAKGLIGASIITGIIILFLILTHQ